MALQNNKNAKANVLNTILLGIKFTTNGVDYTGDLVLTKDGNTYTVVIDHHGTLDKFLSCVVVHSESKRVNLMPTLDAPNRTLVMAFDGPMKSAAIDAIVTFTATPPP